MASRTRVASFNVALNMSCKTVAMVEGPHAYAVTPANVKLVSKIPVVENSVYVSDCLIVLMPAPPLRCFYQRQRVATHIGRDCT